jgi:DNA-binding response OmpR family regulator
MKPTLLAVDDDEAVLDLVRPALERAGYHVKTAAGADEALQVLKEGGVDLLLLDIQLPGLSGLDLLGLLKKDPATVNLPVILLTTRNEERTRVEGLKTGADDYVTKPFSLAELAARVEALLRRTRYAGAPAPVIALNPFRLEMESREATAGGEPLNLTGTEFHLLALLAQNPGRVITVDALTRRLSPDDREVSPDTVYAHIRNLRKKLGRFKRSIRSVHGMGYKLVPGVPPAKE